MEFEIDNDTFRGMTLQESISLLLRIKGYELDWKRCMRCHALTPFDLWKTDSDYRGSLLVKQYGCPACGKPEYRPTPKGQETLSSALATSQTFSLSEINTSL